VFWASRCLQHAGVTPQEPRTNPRRFSSSDLRGPGLFGVVPSSRPTPRRISTALPSSAFCSHISATKLHAHLETASIPPQHLLSTQSLPATPAFLPDRSIRGSFVVSLASDIAFCLNSQLIKTPNPASRPSAWQVLAAPATASSTTCTRPLPPPVLPALLVLLAPLASPSTEPTPWPTWAAWAAVSTAGPPTLVVRPPAITSPTRLIALR